MHVVVQRESIVTSTLITAHGVPTDVLAAAVVDSTFVFVWNKHTRETKQSDLLDK